jgi:hypothetical protein
MISISVKPPCFLKNVLRPRAIIALPLSADFTAFRLVAFQGEYFLSVVKYGYGYLLDSSIIVRILNDGNGGVTVIFRGVGKGGVRGTVIRLFDIFYVGFRQNLGGNPLLGESAGGRGAGQATEKSQADNAKYGQGYYRFNE